MAIQMRRGAGGAFDPSKMLPGEFAVVLSGDPEGQDGEGTYIAYAPGNVKRLLADGDTLNGANIAEGTVRTEQVADQAITEDKLADGAVTNGKLGSGSVDGGKLALSSVGPEHIVDGAVNASKLANRSVTSSKLADGAVNDDKLDPGGVLSAVANLREQLDHMDVAIDPDDLGLYQDEETLYVYPTYRGVPSANGIPLASSGGGGGGGNNAIITVTNTSGWLSRTVSAGAACPVSLEWSSLEDNIPTGDGTLTVTVGGLQKHAQDVAQGAVTIDVGPFLAAGRNTVKVRVADVYGNSRTITYTISAVELSMGSTFDTSGTFPAGQPVEFTYTPTGAVEKSVKFAVDGTVVATATVSTSGRQQTQAIPAMAHGAHTLEAWFDATVDGQPVQSNRLRFALTVVDPTSRVPIIASSFGETQATQYQTLVIPYSVYTPASLTSEVVLEANGQAVSTQTVDRTLQAWRYRCDAVGSLTLAIKSGTASKTFTLTVAESQIDVHAETDALVLHLDAVGRSNNEAHPEVWEDSENHVSCTLTGFNFTSDGWLPDGDGVTALKVAGNARVTVPYQPFASDFRTGGKTLEFEFATRDVRDYDAVIMSCMQGGRGFALTAQRASLASEQTAVATQYKEDEHVRVSFVAGKRAEGRLLYVYINGIASGVVQYPDDDDFSQPDPVGISIGAAGCTVDVYAIRIYDNALTRYQVLDNWIADTADVELMLERYSRNEVYDDYGAIVIGKLPADLPYMVITCPELPQYKGDKKQVEVRYVDPVDGSRSFTATGCQANVQGTSSAPYARKNYDLQFKGGFELASGHAADYELADGIIPFNRFVIKADVASSEGANNVELVKLFCEADPYKRPEETADPMVRKGIYGFPIVLFWEDAGGNVRFMGKYNFNLPKRAPAPYGYTGNMESWEFQNNTSNLLLFKTDYFDQSPMTDPATGETKAAWRFDYEARFPEDTWVNIAKLQELQTFVYSTYRAAATGGALASAVTYTETRIVVDEVVDPETGAISYVERVVTEDVTYTTDTAAYRLSRFKHEFPKYAEVDSFIFYYIFTELFLMVDSRAKNLFIGFSGGEATGLTAIDRKAVAEPYDMDTALGTNNEGSLVFGYSLEDTDTIGGADVFNGQDSVLWCNIRDAYPTEIARMYLQLRSAGVLSYDNVRARFEQHQAKWPEAVFNEDARFKYIDPLVAPDDGKDPTAVYLPMLQGSKAEQRKWWLYNRFRYMDSKWNAGDALADAIQLRGYAKADITVTPYADIYPAVKYGSYYVAQRGEHGVPATLVCPLDTLNDTEIYIYSAPQLASVGDLSGLKVGLADFSKATRLQSIKVGDGASGYANPNLTQLDVGNNSLLSTVDARNCTALAGAVDLSGAANIEHVLFQGTAVTGVNLPVGGILKELRLPATVANLTVRNQGSLASFSMAGYSNVTTLRVENTPSVPVADILAAMAAGSRVRLIGFEMTVSTTAEVDAFVAYLDTMRGLDEAGNNLPNAVVSGTIHGLGSISGAWLASVLAKYPNLDIEYEHITSTLNYYSWDGQTLITSQAITDGGDGTYTGQPTRTSTAQYSYTFAGWSLDMDSETADPDATKNVLADRDVYAAYTKAVRTYTVRFLNEGGAVLQTNQNVPYGGSVTYTGSTPVHPTAPDDNVFEGWNPQPTNIQGDTDCIAQYKDISNPVVGIIQRTIKTAEDSVVTQIRYYAFYNCQSLKTASFPNATIIGSNAFATCASLESAYFPKVSEIGTSAFVSCGNLRAAYFPEATSINGKAFANCTFIESLDFPNATYIGPSAFQACGSLNAISIPKVSSILENAFQQCNYLSTISLPAVSLIGASVFYYCGRLVELHLEGVSSVPALGANAFSYCPIGGYSDAAGQYGSVYVPASLYEAFCSATNWSTISSRIVSVS